MAAEALIGRRPILKLHAVKAMLEVATVLGVVGWRTIHQIVPMGVVAEAETKSEILGKMSTRLLSLSVAAGPISTPHQKKEHFTLQQENSRKKFQRNVRFSIDYDGRRLSYCYCYY